MSSEQVAAVLRQSSMHGQIVKFIVARPIHNPVGDIELASGEMTSSLSEKIEFDANNKPIITNLKSPNSKSVVVRTSEILGDKKLNLMQLIETEQDKMPSQSDATQIQHQSANTKEETEIPKTVEDNVIQLDVQFSDDFVPDTLLDALNLSLKSFSIVLDSFDDEENKRYYFVKNIEIDNEKATTKLEIYDYLIEINNQQPELVNDPKILGNRFSLKFRNDFYFKLKVILPKLYIFFYFFITFTGLMCILL